MATPSAKELKKLAKACRDAGIHYFKGDGFEFTLTGVAPEKPTRKNSAVLPEQDMSKIETDSLSEEELMFWSTGGGMNFFAEDKQDGK
jgi:hypothetical protein